MPIGNPAGYGGRMKSSGAMATQKLKGIQSHVMKHKGRSALIGGAAIGAIGIGRSRRSGLDKTKGRPTGMYQY
jgi:hypothetical protein